MDKYLIRNILQKDECQCSSSVPTSGQLDSFEKRIIYSHFNAGSKKLDSDEPQEPLKKRFRYNEDFKAFSSEKISIQHIPKKEDASIAALSGLCSYGNKVLDNQGKKNNESESKETPDPFRKHTCCEITFPNSCIKIHKINTKTITAENLNLKYGKLFCNRMADYIYERLEREVEYFSGDLMKVRVYGKWHNIPRKQVSFGDPGLSYSFSGNCVPAVSWEKCKVVKELKEVVEYFCNQTFNFVLVNRYKDGLDHMGEHRDDEKDLVPTAPIASLSFGQTRDFVFRHKDSRGQRSQRKIDPVKLELEHGSLLSMLYPTNLYWYHSLPVRKKLVNTRINLTFREMVKKV